MSNYGIAGPSLRDQDSNNPIHQTLLSCCYHLGPFFSDYYSDMTHKGTLTMIYQLGRVPKQLSRV